MIQIKFKDIDPDTGNISQTKVIATCETTEQAKWLIEALYKHSDEPNRDFFRDVVINTPTETQKSSSKKKKQTSEEAIQKANEIDEEIRRQAVLKHQAEHKERQKANQEANKQKSRPSNNGYVPYDQFKFE